MTLRVPPRIHRRFRRGSLWIGAALILIMLVVAEQSGWILPHKPDDMHAYHGMHVRVLRVIDGDSLEVDVPDALQKTSTTRVCLFGVNCPELARQNQTSQPLAVAAMEFTRAQVEGVAVTLWLESHQTRDALGRVLAHVEVQAGSKLNEMLLEAGLAKVDDRWPHSMMTRYAQLQFSAQRRAIGMWSKTSGA